MMLVRSEWERLWAKKVTWLCFAAIPVMLLGAAKYCLEHNQEVPETAVDYAYANSFPVLALSEMLMSICNLILLVMIVLVFAQEYHSGQMRMVLQRYLHTIERNTNRMAKLLQEFHTVNELDSFAFQLFLSEVNLQSFYRKKIEEYECIAKKKEIEWDVMFENNDDIETLVFDQERMSQVMDNIVMNGVRFTPEKGKMLIKVRMGHDEFQFHVYDSGSGFQSGDAQKVFQRFYQEDRSRSSSKEHSGLGLYIAKTIVEKHSGNIFAENSAVCGGAHVWFVIPRTVFHVTDISIKKA